MFSNTFAGIAPTSAPLFVVAELLGGSLGFVLVRTLYTDITAHDASSVTVVHGASGEGA
jgi:arsenate reductase